MDPKTPDARLIDLKNVTGKQVFKITNEVTLIGRSSANDFIVLKDTVSGSHARIEYGDGFFTLEDLGSTNKTRVNGVVLTPGEPVRLNDGDEVLFDVYKFIFIVEKKVSLPEVGPENEEEPAHHDSVRPSAPKSSDAKSKKVGSYAIVELIGRGGFGSVWKATDARGRDVAVKFLNPDFLDNERAVRKFFHEAIILSRLTHPNITRFIDFFPENNNYVIVMDYIDGADLKSLLKRQSGPLPLTSAAVVAEQVLDAFHYAQQQQILHRDIKPENIMIDSQGNAKIMDFGIAKMSSAATQNTAAFMISTHYTPPERFDRNATVDMRSDIYSLGLVFYELFTGRHPFDATSPSDIIFAHMNEIPDPPEQYADVPHRISQAILKALEKDPEDRYQDFAQFKKSMFGLKDTSMTDRRKSETARAGKTGTVPSEDETVVPGLPAVYFDSPYFEAGVSILNYFVGILRRYPRGKTKARIVQQGTRLVLTIEGEGTAPDSVEKDMHRIAQLKAQGRKSE
ncbi:MAG: serine/threonine-protein kinase [Desulfobacteraceae bacterium]|nr:serine/threonine-protein kinase [Desulfobacteraceae bacterium]